MDYTLHQSIHPCSFIEFLTAVDKGRFVELISKAELLKAFHEEILQHSNLYSLIGGMPEIVARYAASQDFVSLSGIFNQILNDLKTMLKNMLRAIHKPM